MKNTNKVPISYSPEMMLFKVAYRRSHVDENDQFRKHAEPAQEEISQAHGRGSNTVVHYIKRHDWSQPEQHNDLRSFNSQGFVEGSEDFRLFNEVREQVFEHVPADYHRKATADLHRDKCGK
eukprot:CAMPEP_0168355996 /NCGR_PEP_ID=MMETSP0213-20121227/24895_1 /TAXON_ID=151035 /ORGANISM="Euplotes harpa, Strain FSP1.4" /LENGTH=121 /DNA_ID=CAMNT_0008368337 /DNA_START=233 /DNA_END=598 /DNA_ORIENTATION=+